MTPPIPYSSSPESCGAFLTPNSEELYQSSRRYVLQEESYTSLSLLVSISRRGRLLDLQSCVIAMVGIFACCDSRRTKTATEKRGF